jgi:hypothetical protein
MTESPSTGIRKFGERVEKLLLTAINCSRQ